MQKLQIVVRHEVGLHARPASQFVKVASGFQSEIKVRNLTSDSAPVDAKSILSVLTLGVERDHEIALEISGPDEVEALHSLQGLIEADFPLEH